MDINCIKAIKNLLIKRHLIKKLPVESNGIEILIQFEKHAIEVASFLMARFTN